MGASLNWDQQQANYLSGLAKNYSDLQALRQSQATPGANGAPATPNIITSDDALAQRQQLGQQTMGALQNVSNLPHVLHAIAKGLNVK